ncbi:TPA: hypothetical protein N0F65_002189 [Lagenidium giganteum]|uniref:WRKY19-like zinc finger domain-containing protein n=1 Tax=Lagenidium giganteum TaxID=4803 RepID=A0AAV2YHQ6_9STRA|nr:TPA: hypothetical protein N0F65_002189 [Lagenidium giganteum]
MCRPIESRDSLGAMGPAAAALFAGYQPNGNKSAMMSTAKMNALGSLRGGSVLPPWSPALASMTSPSNANFGADGMSMLSMAAPPPSLPFVSFPKNLPSMPWMNASTPTNGPSNADLLSSFSLDDQLTKAEEVKPQMTISEQPFDSGRTMAEDLEAAELEDLLDFTIPDDAESIEKDKDELVNLDDGFDGTEMSILYSFLVDAPEDKAEKKVLDVGADDGLLNLNLLASTPLETLIDSLDEDFTTDEEFKMSPTGPNPELELQQVKTLGEMKSRRLCKAEGCYKRSRSNGLCISHGGGRRCAVEGCDKSSQGGNLCIRHGGGKRCSHDGCDKAAQSNFLCKAHGGGPRCQHRGCTRSSQGGGFCRSHGGGKRCMFDGCTKGTQRGDYCALHGGSRLCEVPGCMRNDRGGGLCATHGGGKRCTIDGCGKPCRRKGLCSAHLRQIENAK